MKYPLRIAIWIWLATAPLHLFAQKVNSDPVKPNGTTTGRLANTQNTTEEGGSLDDLVYKARTVPPSPTAASMARFIDFPVSYYTGTPQISIPLLGISEKEIGVNLSLDYHAGGLKVDELPGWVGTNWALSGIGVITRTLRGKPDESVDGFLNQDRYNQIQAYAASNVDDINVQYFPLLNYAQGNYDSQPDQFFFSIPGYSGKFYLKPGGEVVTVPYQKIKIVPTIGGNNGTELVSFSVTTVDGTVYLFNQPETSTAISFTGEDYYNSSWYLSTITSPNGYSLTYEYFTGQSSDFSTKVYATQKLTQNLPSTSCPSELSTYSNTNVTISNAKKIKKIISSNGYIEFFISALNGTYFHDVRLDKIELHDAAGNLIKGFNFGYGTMSDRVKLASITEFGQNNSFLPGHVFTYDETTVPALYSNSQDHWGYNNGASNFGELYPPVEISGTIYSGADRNTNVQYLQGGSLKSILYPTGGLTSFEYTAHQAEYDGTVQDIGGLRIKRMVHSDPVTSNSFQRDFSYDQGVLFDIPSYFYNQGARSNGDPSNVYNCTYLVRSAMNQTTLGNGEHVVYQHVTEYNTTPETNGKTEYFYSLGDQNLPHTGEFPFAPFTDYSWRGGLLLEKRISSSAGNVLSKEINTYTEEPTVNATSFWGFGLGLAWTYTGPYLINSDLNVTYSGMFRMRRYGINSRWQYLSKTESYLYDQGDQSKEFKTTREFFYENPLNAQLTRQTTTDSKNSISETTYKYPQDFSSTFPYNEMISSFIVNPVIERQEKIANSNTHFQKTEYNKFVNMYLPKRIKSRIASGTEYEEMVVNTYDSRGNITGYKDRNGITTQLEWYQTVGKKDLLYKKNLGAGTDKLQTSIYDYKPLVGISTKTDASGRSIFYNYDQFSRLSEIRENNANGNLLQSFEYKYGADPGSGLTISTSPNIGAVSSPGLISQYSRVLIVGNSITKLVAQSEPDGWRSDALIAEGGWGRASSTKAKDFAHILESRFRVLNPSAQVLPLWEASFERNYITNTPGWTNYDYMDLQSRILTGFGGANPDLIIIRLGENVSNSHVEPYNFKLAFNTLINKIQEISTPGAKIILTNSMWPDQPLADAKIQEVATERGLPFVNLSDMISNPVYLAGNDPISMTAFPNNAGDRHPGDAGMLEIADRIWGKVRNVDLASNIGGNVSKVRLYPRTDCCMNHIVGSVIQGSNDISNANGWTTLATINEIPISGWNEYFIRTTTAWRYLRFLAGPNCSGELKELEFYNGSSKLAGSTFGSSGYGIVFDGETTTSSFWEGTAPGSQNYAGIDLGAGCSALTASVLSPANNASVVGTASSVTAGRVITAISVSACAPTGTAITSVEVWAATSDGGFPNRMGYAVADASQPGVYKLSATEGSANGNWPVAYLDPGTYRFYAVINTGTASFTTAYNTITLTAPTGTGCTALTGSVLSPANNASVVGTASTTTAGRVTTAISVTTCAPTGTTITSVEVWAATSDGGFPTRMGYAVADASQPGVYKLSATEGSANGNWPVAYLDPGTYRFYAVVKAGTDSITTAYNTITLTAPAGTGCTALTGSVLSPANNASVVGTASTVTAGRVITAISVSACPRTGTSISSVEVWAATSDGGFPNRMGYAVADASQPGVYKLSATEGSANGNWPVAYLDPGTYRFYAVVKAGTDSITTAYNTITLTAPTGTGCTALTGSVLSPANNASIVGTASTTTAGRVTTAISITTCAPTGTAITSVEVWAATSDGGFPTRMGYAVADASQPGVYKLSATEGSANGNWPVAYLDPGTYRFYAVVYTGTTSITTAYNTITLTAPTGTGCTALTGSVLSPANNASVVGTASTVTAGRVITAISVSACAPTGAAITSVEVWAATSDGGFPTRMGYAVADASQPGVYKLSATEGSANGNWPVAYLDPGTYRFYAVVYTGTTSITTAYNTITLTAPTGTGCTALTGSVLSPANNASVVGTASTVTAGRVITAISVSACPRTGTSISSVEVWAATSTGGFPNRMGYAVADASQPGVYKLSATEGSANGNWPVAYLDPGTYRFHAVVKAGTDSITTAYNTITLTAPTGTGCTALTGSVLSPANNASVVGTASTTTAGRVTTAISITTCAPTGTAITSVEVWAATSDGGFPTRMGYAVADASQPGVYKLSSTEGSANGQWPVAYLDPGTYRFYAVINTGTASNTTDYITITLTTP